jgi:hypothetical protein
MNQKEDAALGLLCQAAYYLRGSVERPPSSVPLPIGWDIKGYLSAQDSICGQLGERVYYGYLAQSRLNGEFVAAIRGTIDMIEWGENGEFALKSHPVAGKVETGFDGIYRTLQLDHWPADAGIFRHVGTTARLTVVGHSLGAAIGTYLTFDYARIPATRVRARLFASPHPGNAAFVTAFDSTVADYVAYAYDLDVVPRVPIGFGYSCLPKTNWLSPHTVNTRIKFSVECHHSMVSYIAMLDPARTKEAIALDQACAECVICSAPAA